MTFFFSFIAFNSDELIPFFILFLLGEVLFFVVNISYEQNKNGQTRIAHEASLLQ